MKLPTWILSLSCGINCTGGARAPSGTLARLPTMTMSCRGQPLVAEIADDPASRDRGLMFRRSLDRDAGMLFVFATDDEVSFWMKDTYLPLSIAFISAEGRIVNVEDMDPFD